MVGAKKRTLFLFHKKSVLVQWRSKKEREARHSSIHPGNSLCCEHNQGTRERKKQETSLVGDDTSLGKRVRDTCLAAVTQTELVQM